MDALHRLKNDYLPELRNTYHECIWLWSKLGLHEKSELLSGEARLLQFANVVDTLVQQIEGFNTSTIRKSDLATLEALEAKISTTILPIKQRLTKKLQEANFDVVLPPSTESSFEALPPPQIEVTAEKKKRKRIPRKKAVSAPPLDTAQQSIASSSSSSGTISPSGVSDSLSEYTLFNPANAFLNDDMNDYDTPMEDSFYNHFEMGFGEDYGYELNFNAPPLCYPTGMKTSTATEASSIPKVNGKSKVTASAAPSVSTTAFVSVCTPSMPVSMPVQMLGSLSQVGSMGSLANFQMQQCGDASDSVDDYISPKRRRRLNQIVPNPRKPRVVEYQCSVCSEAYQMVTQDNAWWAVYVHECPFCKTFQVPRIDISLSCNAIELDPNIVALYGEGVDDEEDDFCDDEDEGDEEDNAMSAPEDENPFEGSDALSRDEAAKLLVLMCHARTCTGSHSSPKHAEVCTSTKFLMLHIRDCNGIDIYGNECKFPWCTPCKRMIMHLTRCVDPTNCSICNPLAVPEPFQKLHAINHSRAKNTKNELCDPNSMSAEHHVG